MLDPYRCDSVALSMSNYLRVTVWLAMTPFLEFIIGFALYIRASLLFHRSFLAPWLPMVYDPRREPL